MQSVQNPGKKEKKKKKKLKKGICKVLSAKAQTQKLVEPFFSGKFIFAKFGQKWPRVARN